MRLATALETRATWLCNIGVELVGGVLLLLPCMHHGLACVTNKEFGVAARVCGAALAACASVIALVSAGLQYDALKVSRHVFSTALPRVELLRTCATLAVSLAFYFTGFDSMPHEIRPVLVSALLAAYAVVAAVLVGFTLFAIECASVVPTFIVGFFASLIFFKLTTRSLHNRVLRYVTATETDEEKEFDGESEDTEQGKVAGEQLQDGRSIVLQLSNHRTVTMATMHVFWDVMRRKEVQAMPRDAVVDRMSQIILMAMKESAYNEAMYCLFTLNSTTEFQHLFVHLKRAFNLAPWLDVYILLTRIDEHRRDMVQSLDHGAEEIQLGITEADKHTHKASELLQKFWMQLLMGKYDQLMRVVASLDNEEHKALDIFAHLQAKYPKSTKVMRCRAKFIAEVIRDTELAHNLLLTADELGEQQTKSLHKRHRRKFKLNASKVDNAAGDVTPQKWNSSKVAPLDTDDLEQSVTTEVKQANVTFQVESENEKTDKTATVGYTSEGEEGAALTDAAEVARQQKAAGTGKSDSWYRQQVNLLRSRAFLQSFGATWLIIAILLANIVVSFAFVKRGFNNVQSAFTLMSDSSYEQWLAPKSVITTSNLLQGILKNDSAGVALARWDLLNVSQLLTETETSMYTGAATSSSIPVGEYTRDTLVCANYLPNTHTHEYANCSLHELVLEVSRRLGALARDESVVDRRTFDESPDVRYILDNCPVTVRVALEKLVEFYEKDALDVVKQGERILIILIPCTVAVMMICLAVFFIRSILMMHLVLLTPNRLLLTLRTGAKANQYINHDLTYYNTMENLRNTLEGTINSYKAVNSKAMKLQESIHGLMKDKAVKNVLYHRNCTGILGLQVGTCTGLEQLRMSYLAFVSALKNANESSLTFNNTDWLAVEALEDGPITTWQGEWEVAVISFLKTKRNQAGAIALVIFCLAWPAALLAYALVHFPLQQIRQNHQYTIRMFLLVPPDVIDSVPQLKEYLETGKHTDRARAIEKMLEDTQTKTEQILQAAADAIIVFDSESTYIEIFNAAAVKIFGYSANEILGLELAVVLPEYDGTSSTTRAKHKDGTLFPVFVSKSDTLQGGVSAVFVRDTRDIEEYQQLIRQNETLLCKMLPANIATRLKDTLVHGTGESKLIADSHSSVSVLFADIVKFSQWSTTIEAEQLVFLLNSIVSAWDIAAAQRGVEKIKTIGDCYMCVCGCPEPNENHAAALVTFGCEMLHVLRAFNEEHGTDLHVRVGINSAPVVAGVIGLSKVIYDLWGPSVNLASRMESFGIPDEIQITEHTHDLLKEVNHEYADRFSPRGEIEVKGGFKVHAFHWAPEAWRLQEGRAY
eukprot:TRINITY_DN33_c3_g1_i1.p1 TRINITY_DN33_c3_g1~~TRINITY_DN33_c3_g1_i1.p1  ORF type:complete len:1332 (+),score=381.30 TRINITY_DN33_c3_g1_i1:681-4676(+)